jgi:hypothetical protein
MTRLVVTAEAEADTHEILSYLEREAGSSIAAEYGSRFLSALGLSSICPKPVRQGQALDRVLELESFRPMFWSTTLCERTILLSCCESSMVGGTSRAICSNVSSA